MYGLFCFNYSFRYALPLKSESKSKYEQLVRFSLYDFNAYRYVAIPFIFRADQVPHIYLANTFAILLLHHFSWINMQSILLI